jgi:hypothetical protein
LKSRGSNGPSCLFAEKARDAGPVPPARNSCIELSYNAGATPNWMARLETLCTQSSWSFDVVSRIVSPGSRELTLGVKVQF